MDAKLCIVLLRLRHIDSTNFRLTAHVERELPVRAGVVNYSLPISVTCRRIEASTNYSFKVQQWLTDELELKLLRNV